LENLGDYRSNDWDFYVLLYSTEKVNLSKINFI
jgi:hypothetical protein